MKFKFTPKERRRLRSAGITAVTQDQYSVEDILSAVRPNTEREKEIRVNFASAKSVRGMINLTGVNSLATHAASSLYNLTSPLSGSSAIGIAGAINSATGINNLIGLNNLATNAGSTLYNLTSPLSGSSAVGIANAINSVTGINKLIGFNTLATNAGSTLYNLTSPLSGSSAVGIASAINSNVASINNLPGFNNLATHAGSTLHNLASPLSGSSAVGIASVINSVASINNLTGFNNLATHAGSTLYNLTSPLSGSSAVGIASVINSVVSINNLTGLNALAINAGSNIHKLTSPITGSLINLTKYKNLGIGTIIANFSTNHLESIYTPLITSSLLAVSALTKKAESNLSLFDWTNMASHFHASENVSGIAQANFLSFTQGYRDVLREVEIKPNWMHEAPEIALAPSQEYYTSSQLLRIVNDDEPETVTEVAETIIESKEGKEYIAEFLPKLDQDLPILWHGAVHSLRSDNPDRVRHFITSLRELFTHVLHILAPDDSFALWDQKQIYYDNKRPTRRGRLLFICRNMSGSSETFAKFMQNDVDSAVSLIQLFQGGTHKIRSNFTSDDLEIILIRAELTLLTLLRVEFRLNRR